MVLEYIIAITAFVATMSGLFGKIHWDSKRIKTHFKLEFTAVKNEVHLLRRDINGILIDRDFRKALRNSIMNHVAMYVKVNKGSSRKVKNILSFWGDEVDALASRWYNSEYRGVENNKKMTLYLMDWVKGRLSVAKHFLNDEIKGVRIEHDRDKTGILFSEWIEKNNLYAQFEILIGALAKNGYAEEDEILIEFTEFIDKFFELFLSLVLSWKLLKEKVYEDYS